MGAVVNIDISQFARWGAQLMTQLQDQHISTRPIAVELVGILHKRIHTEGRAATGNLIGDYSEPYLKRRKKKGLGPGTKVIAVFTRKTSNSWAAFPTDRGYAVGFVDQGAGDGKGLSAMQKIKYIEHLKNAKILDLTQAERTYAHERIVEIATDIIKKLQQ